MSTRSGYRKMDYACTYWVFQCCTHTGGYKIANTLTPVHCRKELLVLQEQGTVATEETTTITKLWTSAFT